MGKITTTTHAEKAFLKQEVMNGRVTIDSGALDAGNTGQTHILRAGLVLGIITAQGTYVEYDDDGTDDGRRVAQCVLMQEIDLKDGDPGASATDLSNVSLSGGLTLDSLRAQVAYTTGAAMPVTDWTGAMVELDGFLYYAGGQDNNKALKRYDPETDSWAYMTPMIGTHSQCVAGVINGLIYVAGGGSSRCRDCRSRLETRESSSIRPCCCLLLLSPVGAVVRN